MMDELKKVTIDGHEYSIGKLTAMEQFHVVRRLTPLFAGLAGSFKSVVLEPPANGDTEGETPKRSFADLLSKIDLGPLVDALSKMDDDTAEYVVFKCAEVVRRNEKGAWAKINTGRRLMFQDIEMATLLQITREVIEVNLASFFASTLLPSDEPAK